ncbi:hypothetical protein MTR67_012555 [Solanum verrucosum]|uniref:Uncharacterized protein n=1 Tax=Solanum verrucosum TaxID=315347 RepID=A0AAF0QD91_SOLVR|nr:hypothetical protein MTR67_012555 [Solanum verrucosum]
MSWEPILWLIFLAINISLISLLIYQIVCLTDLEADYMNPYESSSRINSVVLKEYILHGAFCILFLVTGHWFIFLLTLLPAYYNVRKSSQNVAAPVLDPYRIENFWRIRHGFLSRQHLIDVTEVFRFIESEKKIRILKLGFYLVLFVLVLVRISNEGTHSLLCYQFSHPLLEILTFSLQFLNSGQYLGLIGVSFDSENCSLLKVSSQLMEPLSNHLISPVMIVVLIIKLCSNFSSIVKCFDPHCGLIKVSTQPVEPPPSYHNII